MNKLDIFRNFLYTPKRKIVNRFFATILFVPESKGHPTQLFKSRNHRRRIYTEEKAKVVAAAWGTAFLQFLAAQANLHQDDLKNGVNCIRTIWRMR